MNNLQQQLRSLGRGRSPGPLCSRSLALGWGWSRSAPLPAVTAAPKSGKRDSPVLLALVGTAAPRKEQQRQEPELALT